MRMRRWKSHSRRGCFPTSAGWLRGASFGAGFTAHAGDTGTETRFLVDDPAATNTTYTKEGELWTPRSDTILRVYDAVVYADPEGALN